MTNTNSDSVGPRAYVLPAKGVTDPYINMNTPVMPYANNHDGMWFATTSADMNDQ